MQAQMEIVGSAVGAAHNGQICSTWGNFHFSTFDGDFFQLPYACNYILTTMCDSTNSDFNIQLRREYKDNLPAISSFTINLEGVPIMLHQGNITLNDKVLTIPGYYKGIRIEKTTNYIKISSKIGLTVYWDEDNSLSVQLNAVEIEVSTNYRNKTCGLCGDFNGILQNEFIENGLCGNFNDMQGDDFKTHSGLIEGTSTSFASSWKVKLCQDFSATLSDPCSMSVEKEKYAKQWCEMLSDPTGVFSPCHFELNPRDYVTDYCGDCNSGSFRIITENIPCGTTGTTCSKSIKIFLGGTVCGLCGNYDGDWNNDFMTRGGEGVADPAEFGNSWRVSTTCPEASGILSPCDMRPYRQAWAMKQCSILKSDVFSTCHSVVFVNNVLQKSTVSRNTDFTITTTGIAITLDIPAIQAQVTFKGMNFIVNLPFSLFHNNTEGQCGKCDNNSSNDCRLPNGQEIQSCEAMAPKWLVNTTACPTPSPLPTPSPKPCDPAICRIILSKVFQECHKVLDPENFYKACVFDMCNMQNGSMKSFYNVTIKYVKIISEKDATALMAPLSLTLLQIYAQASA
ncbi:intestinal mucin-like protein, partial [Clarias magur]